VVTVKLEKSFAAGHTEATKEESARATLPPGKIIGWLIISPSGAGGNVFWWVQIDGHKVLPWLSTPGNHYLTTDVMAAFVQDSHPAWKTPRKAKLVGWNQHVATAYLIQVGVVIETE